MITPSPNYELILAQFAETARQACHEIERLDLSQPQPLLASLIQLLRDSNNLLTNSIETDDYDLPQHDQLPDALNRIADDLSFNVIFDPLNSNSVCTTTVKDALADIYKSLNSGLRVLDQDQSKRSSVFWEWRHSYEFHWGRHLLDIIGFFVLVKEMPK